MDLGLKVSLGLVLYIREVVEGGAGGAWPHQYFGCIEVTMTSQLVMTSLLLKGGPTNIFLSATPCYIGKRGHWTIQSCISSSELQPKNFDEIGWCVRRSILVNLRHNSNAAIFC